LASITESALGVEKGLIEMAAKKHTVKFTATKTVKEPTEVKFKTRTGEKVKFEVAKPMKKKVRVKFQAKG
jgi:hypothetical protein